MKRIALVGGVSLLSCLFLASCVKSQPKGVGGETSQEQSQQKQFEKQDKKKDYWTCTMHPEVHKDGPGECPICGMPLVHVEEPTPSTAHEVKSIEIATANANIAKFEVKKKDFKSEILVSGRMLSNREVAFQIYESDRPFIKLNMEIAGYSSLHPDELKKGRIQSIENFIEPTSRTIRINAQFDSSLSDFIADGSFYGKILISQKDQIVIPEDAVMHTGKKDIVYVILADGKLEAREVMLGQKSSSEYQILSGLKEGELISSGANFLFDSEAKMRGL